MILVLLSLANDEVESFYETFSIKTFVFLFYVLVIIEVGHFTFTLLHLRYNTKILFTPRSTVTPVPYHGAGIAPVPVDS